jgi:hypothetical protein
VTGWRSFDRVPPFWAFIASLLFGRQVKVDTINPNKPGTMIGWTDADLEHVVREGRAQLDRQRARYEHVTSRGQALLTISLLLLGFSATVLQAIRTNTTGGTGTVIAVVWAIGALGSVAAALGAGAIIVVQGTFTEIDTTQMSNWSSPVLQELAKDYAESVISGENTVAARVAMLRRTTQVLLWSATLVAAARIAAAF